MLRDFYNRPLNESISEFFSKLFGPSQKQLAQEAAAEAARLDRIQDIFTQDFRVIFTQPEGPHWEEITGKWYRFDFERGALLRDCQIFIGCFRLACNSRNGETARANRATSMAMWNSGIGEKPSLKMRLAKYLADDEVQDLDIEANQKFRDFDWRIPMHEAEGHINKAAKLKTAKGRAKYLAEASRLLEVSRQVSGFDAEQVDALVLRAAALA